MTRNDFQVLGETWEMIATLQGRRRKRPRGRKRRAEDFERCAIDVSAEIEAQRGRIRVVVCKRLESRG